MSHTRLGPGFAQTGRDVLKPMPNFHLGGEVIRGIERKRVGLR